MIVVATEDFELYHDLVNGLRERRLAFTTIEVDEALPAGTRVVLTGNTDPPIEEVDISIIRGTAAESRQLIDEAVAELSSRGGDIVIGVDPGQRPGIAVMRGNLVVSAFQVPLEQAAERIKAEIEDTPEAIVRIGDGARLNGAKLINELDGIQVELVDETGTTPYIGAGARGVGDLLAAVNIASRQGEPIERREIEPTEGELSRIQHLSRQRSPQNREITAALAEQVAIGELTIEQALEQHREE